LSVALNGLEYEGWVLGFGFWVLGFGFWVLGFGFWVLGFGFWVLGLAMHLCDAGEKEGDDWRHSPESIVADV